MTPTEQANTDAQKDIIYTMTHLFRTKKYADILFTIQSHQISAHKAIIAPQCKILEDAILKAEKESTASKVKVALPHEDDPAILQALLSFLYMRTYENHHFHHASDDDDSLIFHVKMYDTGHRYVLPALKEHAKDNFVRILGNGSVRTSSVFDAARLVYDGRERIHGHGLKKELVEALVRRTGGAMRLEMGEREAFATIPGLAADIVRVHAGLDV